MQKIVARHLQGRREASASLMEEVVAADVDPLQAPRRLQHGRHMDARVLAEASALGLGEIEGLKAWSLAQRLGERLPAGIGNLDPCERQVLQLRSSVSNMLSS